MAPSRLSVLFTLVALLQGRPVRGALSMGVNPHDFSSRYQCNSQTLTSSSVRAVHMFLNASCQSACA